MCFLAVLYEVVPDYPVVAAANRDESCDRPGTPPRRLAPGVWGGQDPRAGGTWLGVNEHGVVVAVANIASSAPPRSDARSRGLLCLDLLTAPRFEELSDLLNLKVRGSAYNPFNLLAAGPRGAWIATFADGRLRFRALGPGVLVVANRPPEEREAKAARGRALIRPPTGLKRTIANLQDACRDHGGPSTGSGPARADAICVHGAKAGTLSSSIIAIHQADPSANVYLHADGRPCEAEYRDLSALLRGG